MPDSCARFLRSYGSSPLLIPIAIALVALLADFGGEGLRLALRYERDAVAAGEVWRLLTGHVVHLGHSHMLLDVVALAVLSLLLAPYMRTRDWLLSTLCGTLSIDAGLFFLDPSIQWYVGLSGWLHAYWATGALNAVSRGQYYAIPLLLLLIAKLVYEGLLGPLALTGDLAGGPVISEAHLYGAVGGVIAWLAGIAIRSVQRPI